MADPGPAVAAGLNRLGSHLSIRAGEGHEIY